MRLVESFLRVKEMPDGIRRIPTNVRSLTGRVMGQEFESSLERDLLLLVHWDEDVDTYQTQPLKIPYLDKKNKECNYTPDILIKYHNQSKDDNYRKPKLCEVKYRDDLFKDWPILKPKFKAGRRYAKEYDWEFKIYTENEIRTPYLKNIQFLWSYRFADFYDDHCRKLLDIFEECGETTPAEILENYFTTDRLKGEALWALWCMVARQWIECDLNVPLKMSTKMRCLV